MPNPVALGVAVVVVLAVSLYVIYTYSSREQRDSNHNSSYSYSSCPPNTSYAEEYDEESRKSRRRRMSESDKCPICMDALPVDGASAGVTRLICSHLMHRDCYTRMKNNGLSRCPTCRTGV